MPSFRSLLTVVVIMLSLLTSGFSQKTSKPSANPKPETKQQGTQTKDKDTSATAPDSNDDKKVEEKKPSDLMSSNTFSGLRFRSIGPALTSGRVAAFAVNPNNRSQYYAAVASGGVWKTVNAGTTWTPIFDNEGSYSIGAITLDPNNPSVVWVGTGENNSQRSVGYGDGVYKSEDGGKSWKNMGLKKSEHIGRILVDPRNSNVVYVAAQGPLWGPGGDRGLYKTTDGGKTWKAVLSISENTGVSDIEMDQENPDVIYASAYQRRRHVFTMINGGPECAIYKTTDAGATWNKLQSGLPGGEMGRIGLAISPVDSSVIYAQVEAGGGRGGVFRSTDRGATWERRNPFDQQAQYYGHLVADPKNVDRLYILGVYIQVSDDGGKTVRPLGERSKHVDSHDMWIDPKDTNYYLVGCDGGIYQSFDRGATWAFTSNLPVAQFYDVAVDNALPFYNVYGGTQDNFSLGGPSRTRSANGILNSDWFVTNGGDGFRSQIDPQDTNTIYAESQYGGLVRFDRRTGEAVGIQPQEGKGEPPLRWNWDSPLLISPHSHTRVYFAANKLYRSDNRGNTWKAISGDLSRQIDRNKLPVMGKVWGPDAVSKNVSTSFFGNIVALTESPKKENLLYVGTDDGLIQITEDGGKSWKKTDKFPGVPDMTYVSRLATSNHEANTVYAAFDNHKNADFKPYLLKSTDAGKTWTSIAANLPENGPVLAIAEDPVNSSLLFVGTEFGLFFSNNGGQKWIQLKSGLPTIAVRDLVIHPREGDLVVATFGRGIYILDDITPLRLVKSETLAKDNHIFPIKDALMFIPSRPLGGSDKAFQGEQFFTAPNPPVGATFTFYVKDSLKTKKQLRQEAEREAVKKGQTYYPSFDELRAEEEEIPPSHFITVFDSSGRAVRNLSAQGGPGIRQVVWNFRFPSTELDRSGGPLVMPGKYSIRLYKKVGGVVTELAGPVSFNVVTEGLSGMKPEDRAALLLFQQKSERLHRAIAASSVVAEELQTRTTAIRKALQETPGVDLKLIATAEQIDQRIKAILRVLSGDKIIAARNENVPTSINERIDSVMGNSRFAIVSPTQTQRDAYAIASDEFTQEFTKLKKLAEVDIVNLQKAMEAAGSPWTPGRLPEWTPEN